ncbi:MAG: chemotaxis protein CheW [Dissulfurimicrobium sp.]|uniref:chemotaxis protein CheW n=1 Tax=Dissulfurimicrobium TaxID=1769732 RepID=UPI001EDAEA92|nr:chemotaxis protein CheW [Dissulfurimicrobium hydrothermale]UKL13935.1 chemotaxis protein CheW [Dissulfurimicrobium hydrothermale]
MERRSVSAIPAKTNNTALAGTDNGIDEIIAVEQTRQFVTFYAGKHFFGLPIDNVIEINRCLNVTPVPLAPDYVSGVVNLRGHILTAIHLGRRIGLENTNEPKEYNNVIVGRREEPISLLVEHIGDVISVPKAEIEPPPDLLAGINVKFVKEVCKLPGKLLVILDCNALESQGLSSRRRSSAGNI